MKYVIAGCVVLDGRGTPGQHLDVYVMDGRISELRPHSDSHAGWDVVAADGLTVTPGFIDVHSHGDNAPFCSSDDTSKILQGVTTEVTGNCGFSLAPTTPSSKPLLADIHPPFRHALSVLTGHNFTSLFADSARQGYVTNNVPLVGQGALRMAAMGLESRRPTTREIRTMQALLRESIEAGIFGLSTGLIYAPGAYTDTTELIELASVLTERHVYASHVRGEGDTLVEAVSEAIEIGFRAGTKVQISHHKACGRRNWGKTKATLKLLESARAKGLDVHQDAYPYLAGSLLLRECLPAELFEGGAEHAVRRLEEPEWLATIRDALADKRPGFENVIGYAGYEGVLISGTQSGRYVGLTIHEAAIKDGTDEVSFIARLLREEQMQVVVIAFHINEADVSRVLSDRHTVIGSDGDSPDAGGVPHPRTLGTFPRVFAEYVRKQHVLSLEAAVHKMTGMPARAFGIHDRGTIAVGMAADLVAFDAAAIGDANDYLKPLTPPVGIEWVAVNGHRVVEKSRYVGPRCGTRVLPRVA